MLSCKLVALGQSWDIITCLIAYLVAHAAIRVKQHMHDFADTCSTAHMQGCVAPGTGVSDKVFAVSSPLTDSYCCFRQQEG